MLGIYWQIPLRRTKKKNLRRDSTGLENDLQIQRPTKIQNRPRMPASPQYQHQGEKRYLVLVFNWSWTGIWLLPLPFKWEVFLVSTISFYPFLLKFSYTLWQSTSHLSPSYPSPSPPLPLLPLPLSTSPPPSPPPLHLFCSPTKTRKALHL